MSENPIENTQEQQPAENLATLRPDNTLWGGRSLQGICAKGCGRSNCQLNTFDYLADVPGNAETTDLVEVQFKNTRKGYYRNDNHLPLVKGDIVAVGHLLATTSAL